jgi:hypothetical protein
LTQEIESVGRKSPSLVSWLILIKAMVALEIRGAFIRCIHCCMQNYMLVYVLAFGLWSSRCGL